MTRAFVDHKTHTCTSLHVIVGCTTFKEGVQMARFYIEGDEIDVQDPLFFLSEQSAVETNNLLEDYINDYA